MLFAQDNTTISFPWFPDRGLDPDLRSCKKGVLPLDYRGKLIAFYGSLATLTGDAMSLAVLNATFLSQNCY